MNDFCKGYDEKMGKTVESVKGDFASVRAGRANAGVLDRIQVEYYLQSQPWDASILKAIEKAIQSSDLGINPQNDGRVIRLSFPQLTEERRVELTKQVRKYGENGKVAIRNIRRDAMDKLKALEKKSEITEDDRKEDEKELQELTDKRCKEIDALTAAKEKELMAV